MRIVSIFLIPLLTGCTMIDTSKIAPGYTQAYIAFSQLLFGYSEEEISYEIIQEIPYASALVRIGNGPSGLMILQERTEEKLTWISADEVYIVTTNGRITRTAGLENNLISSSLPSTKTMFDDSNIDVSNNIYYSYDFPKLSNLKLSAKVSFERVEEVDLLGGKKELRLFKERIYSNKLGWQVYNLYWIDDGNFIWKSVQNISPLLPRIEIEVTKKPS